MGFEIFKSEMGAGRRIEGILFDMDGLVLDSEILYSRFWREACAFYGHTMTYEQSLQMRGLGGQAGENKLHSFFGKDAHYMTLRNKRIELMDAFVDEHGVELKPGIFELMDYLEENRIPAAITSSSPIPRIRKFLAPYGLDSRFAALCSGRDVPKGKPAPDIYLAGARALNLPPEHCLALEDAPAGIESAFRAGCLPVMIPDLDPPGENTIPMLYASADSLSEIPLLIK